MNISVKFQSYTNSELSNVLDYYNSKKKNTDKPLQELDRAEGGFQIELDKIEGNDPNKRIKQLRWTSKRLCCLIYIDFTNDEKKLLYESLCHVFGNENVILEE